MARRREVLEERPACLMGEAQVAVVPAFTLRADDPAHRAALLAAARATDCAELQAALKEFEGYVAHAE